MRAIRAALAAAGIAAVLYGSTLLWDNPTVVLVRILAWGLGAVIVHDAVFAPLCVLVGYTGRKLLPARWRAPVAMAGLCTVVLLLLAIPVFDKPGRRPDNVTVVDRDYHVGLLISLAVVWVAALTYLVIVRRLPVGENEVVERNGSDDVESQPPSP
ncbi:hypothetical protein [Mycobacterium sp. OTB74]|jgi:hypothetical protein|uniref:hypothetical protein n=1 Tax=Mycobacterium sp. OTB74 TaxID=1853452 RepID=UPI00247500EC|nr:hypothetical protein [Mycobacterium sp. OTB74]MDH6244099.1 hypothetical protein [Mycobacterium sp. OTB74]